MDKIDRRSVKDFGGIWEFVFDIWSYLTRHKARFIGEDKRIAALIFSEEFRARSAASSPPALSPIMNEFGWICFSRSISGVGKVAFG